MTMLRSFFSSHAGSDRWLTLANVLTATRILLIPFITNAIADRDWEQATLLFLCAALSDFLDGAVARWRAEITLVGACLDPIADKLLLLSTLGALSITPSPVCVVPGWFFTLVLAKEAALVGGIVLLVGLGSKIELHPTGLAKFATLAQFTLLFLVMWCLRMCWAPSAGLYTSLLGVCVISTCGAFAQYAYVGLRVLVKSALRGQL
jgi:cardiolipin synthase (CMP-forming)